MKKLVLLLIAAFGLQAASASTYSVTSSSNAGSGSLRQTLLEANTNPGLDTIAFNIAGAGVHTIALSTALPTVTSPVFINGYAQPGAQANWEGESSTATILIEINGSSLGITGLDFASGSAGSTISGLAMNRFSGRAIRLQSASSNNKIEGCFIGMNPAGTAASGSGNGIEVYSNNNIIGANYNRTARNLISGNPSTPAILVSGTGAYDNEIFANFIGVHQNGYTVIGGNDVGIRVENGAYNLQIGDAGANDDNWIAGCTNQGIVVTGATTDGISNWGNRIHSNGGIPFDLGDDGVTPNDLGDSDTGPNDYRNFPLIQNAFTDEEGTFYVHLLFQGIPNNDYRLDFYHAGSSAGNGDQVIWLGRITMDSDGSGLIDQHFTTGRWPNIAAGEYITVTATNWNDNSSSESADNFQLVLGELEVSNTNDNINGDISSVIDLILNPGADGISLREAITASNNQETSWGSNHIMFDIAGAGPHIIQPASPLPPLLTQIYIDGWSEPNWAGAPSVRLDGSSAGASSGIDIQSQWCILTGFAIVNFSEHGVLSDANNGDLRAMYIGVLEDGVTTAGNGGFGVSIQNANNWDIGDGLDDLTIISDNALGGVQLTGGDTRDCVVSGCHIGTDVGGNITIGTQAYGVVVENGAQVNYVGYYGPEQWNVIGGHSEHGVLFSGANTNYNKVLASRIGIGRDGNSDVGNDKDGIRIEAGAISTKVGEPSFGNVIGENGLCGVFVDGATSINTEFKDNIIGLNANGTASRPNVLNGIQIVEASGNIIGGSNSNDGNVISGNSGMGIDIWSPACTPCYNEIIGNIIGLDVTGTVDLGNGAHGITLIDVNGTTVGGLTVAHRNIIAGNGNDGISLSSENTDNTVIQGNYIGTDISGSLDRGNDGDGISLYAGPQGTLIGGVSTAARNVIVGNNGDGIEISGAGVLTDLNVIQNNYIGVDAQGDDIIANGFFGINLFQGVTNTAIGGAGVGNVISGNEGHGIAIQDGCTGQVVQGNIIGLNAAGNAPLGNDDDGIRIGGSNNTIGGPNNGERNIISGNGSEGIFIAFQSAANNTIYGNYIGTDITGNSSIGNTRDGIEINQSANNTIGGASSGQGNVIGGNGGEGIVIGGGDASGTIIKGNYIGIGADGTSDVGNIGNGIEAHSGANAITIGGSAAGELNVVSFNGQSGIQLDGVGANVIVSSNYLGTDVLGTAEAGNGYSGIRLYTCSAVKIGASDGDRIIIADNGIDGIRITDASANTIQRCFIGTDVTGTAPLGNNGYGIHTSGNSSFNVVGTDSDGAFDDEEGNIVSANNAGFRLRSTGGGATIVAGNLIGTDVTGNSPMGNANIGIELYNELYCRIGTDGDGVNDINERNVIAANGSNAIRFASASENLVAGNFLGVGLDGTTVMSNGNVAVHFAGTSRDNWIGYKPSTMTVDDASIVGNKFYGATSGALSVTSASVHNRISRNSFANNYGIGIDLNNDEVSENDNGDGDVGANDLLNFPVIDQVDLVGNTLTISGFSRNGMDIEFYLADAGPSPSPLSYAESFGEGETFLFMRKEGSLADLDNTTGSYTDDGTGPGASRNETRFQFDVDVSGMGLDSDSRITALTIESNNNTSEFSAVMSTSVAEVCDNGIDDDGDGLIDCFDPDCNGSAFCGDNDNDGITDAIDLDDDNDGLLDSEECTTLGPELITNGNFENGYANWTSDFNRGSNNNGPTSGGCSIQGWMAITPCATLNGVCAPYFSYAGGTPDGSVLISDPLGSGANQISTSTCNQTGSSCLAQLLPDHTSGTGLSVYVDPNDIVGQAYIKQDVTVMANTYYEFSAWVMVIEEDPNVQFRIDGVGLTSGINLDRLTGGGNGPDVWQEVKTVWYSGSVTGTVEIAMVNLTAGCSGNDIRIDDVSLRQINVDDQDSDGIADCFDLDSDGDGCDDALEAGFADDDFDGELGSSPITVDANGLVTSASSGYSGTQAQVLDANIQLGCADFDNDGISNINDLDDDNDGLVDLTEFDCSSAFLSFNVTWSQSNGGNDAFIHNAGTIASGADVVAGSGLNYTFTSVRTDINSFGSETFAEARTNNEYLEFEFTTQASVNAMLLRDLSHNKNPSSSPDHYGYHVAVTISDDNFSSETVIKNNHYIDTSIPSGWQHDFLLAGLVDYSFKPASTYKFRVYFFKKDNDAVAGRWDDFAFLTFNCSEASDIDGDGADNHQDIDSDGDYCTDVLEAGFTDNNFDGELGDAPVTVDNDGLVTSGTDGYTGTNAFVINPAQQSGCADNDNDLVSDANDLDDDNDGILDVDECSLAFAQILATDLGLGNGESDATATNQDVSSLLGLAAGSVIISAEHIYTRATGTAHFQTASNFEPNIPIFSISGSVPVYVRIRHGQEVPAPGIEDGFSSLNGVGFTFDGSLNPGFLEASNGNDYYVRRTTGGLNAGSLSWTSNTENVGSFEVWTTYSTVSPSNFFIDIAICSDMDLDGISNNIDLDSDNDGIYDCLEAGNAQAFTNGILSGGVDSDGIPLNVSNGSAGVNYTYANSDGTALIDAYAIDSDGDGCFDVAEAGYADANGDGVLGSAPVTVNPINGLVTSGGP